MTKKQLSIGILLFVFGLIIGGLSVTIYFGQSVRNTGELLSLHFRADWERRVFQAYTEEDPRVSMWALKNLTDILAGYLEATQNDKNLIQKDLVLTYARLAIVSKAVADPQGYNENISRALTISKQVYPSLQTEKDILDFVKILDSSVNNKANK